MTVWFTPTILVSFVVGHGLGGSKKPFTWV